MLSIKSLLIYIVIIATLGLILDGSMNDSKWSSLIIGILLAFIIIILIINVVKNNNPISENMVSVRRYKPKNCNLPSYIPNSYNLTGKDEDFAQFGVKNNNSLPYHEYLLQQPHNFLTYEQIEDSINDQRYNHPEYEMNTNGYFLINDKNGLNYKNAPLIIEESKFNYLFSQNNDSNWSPHTHLGKDRGYMNWQPTYN